MNDKNPTIEETPIFVSNYKPLSTVTVISNNMNELEEALRHGYNFLYINLNKITDKETLNQLSKYLTIFDEYCDKYIIWIQDRDKIFDIVRMVSLPVIVVRGHTVI